MKRILPLLVFTIAGVARAEPTREECIKASEDAQLHRIHAQLVSARDKLLVCSNNACPKLVKKDCGDWLDEVERAIPTIVLGAHDPAGKDLTDVRVSIDGVVLADRLDGNALKVDPGPHTVHFEMAGAPPHDEPIIVREGEKARLVSVTLGTARLPQPPPIVRVDVPPPTPKAESRAPSVATWIVGGLGVATLAAAGIVGVVSLVQRQNLFDSCGQAGTCNQTDVDQVYTMYNLAYGGAAIGGALLVTSVVLFFVTRSSGHATTSFLVTPTVGGMSVQGRF